jgi:hypothetical protein
MVESNKKYMKMLVDIVLFESCQGVGLRQCFPTGGP